MSRERCDSLLEIVHARRSYRIHSNEMRQSRVRCKIAPVLKPSIMSDIWSVAKSTREGVRPPWLSGARSWPDLPRDRTYRTQRRGPTIRLTMPAGGLPITATWCFPYCGFGFGQAGAGIMTWSAGTSVFTETWGHVRPLKFNNTVWVY
jgi:hypothetical protein